MYEKFSDEELIEAYKSMLAYSGEPSKEMQDAIEKRGGMDVFKHEMEIHKMFQDEKKRISHEVFALCGPGADVELVKKLVSSSLLSKEELDVFVEDKFVAYQAELKNKMVTKQTVWRSVIGGIVSCIAGAIIWCLLFVFMSPVIVFLFLPVVYFLNYLIVYLITKQTRKNIIVFITGLLSTIISLILAIYLMQNFMQWS